ncbi:hypothetical protein DL770_001887 [Monosporascus sp. CRB-9-2]|nr:hypothetical protein DL770_001887 [Monosporascus sp. CRB-9-2]
MARDPSRPWPWLPDFLRRRQSQAYLPVDSNGTLEDQTSPYAKPEDLERCAANPERRVSFWANGFFAGVGGSLATLSIFSILYWLAPRDLGGSSPNREEAGNESLARYPTDFLRDVVPIPCHSHNDYWREMPLFSAIRTGCISVEADVWLFDESTELLVGHDTAALTANRTFRSLYVNPLVELLDQMNPKTPFYDGTRRGVFDVDPEQSLTLLVDVKTNDATTWPLVLEQLEPLRSRGWLTYLEGGVVHERPVTVVGTGNAPFDPLTDKSAHRDTFFDAPLDSLWKDPEVPDMETVRPYDYYNRTNSFYASTSFKEAVGPVSHGALSEDQLRTIRGQIKGAHSRGLKARYWETPNWPIALRNSVWHTLVTEGVDILNVDDLHAASELVW